MSAIVKIEAVWKEERATGEPCCACTDKMYLSQYRFTVDLGDRRINTDFIICNSCHDLLKDKDA